MFWILGLVAAEPFLKLEATVPEYNAETSMWIRGDRAASDHTLKLTVAVRVEEEARKALDKVFWEVSDPDHAKYGQHLTLDEVTELLAVPEERVHRVRDYFLGAGAVAAEVAPNKDMITIQMPVSAVEESLQTEIHQYTHMEHENTAIMRAARPYSLPESIAKDVVMVGELLQFPRLSLKKLQGVKGEKGTWKNACDSSACEGLVTPAVLAERYKLPAAGAYDANSKNKQAVAEFQGQYYTKSDIDSFGKSCKVPNVDIAKTKGDASGASAGIEAELDIEYIKAVNPSTPLNIVYSSQYSLLDWANSISSDTDAAQVHSVSYGNDEKQQTGTEFMLTCNTAFQKAGARGISILFASGDQGVCGREGCGWFKKHFNPDFPGGSPYITVVGGTDFAGDVVGEEMVWSAGGGGFSDTFAIPAYQADAVAAYKKNPDAKLPPQQYWNNTGRGYPDVAALGGQKAPYCINSGGSFTGVAGTSAACPVVAGIFSRINGLRLAAGKPVMGFLNPFIYKNPSGFQDVTKGRNDDGTSYGFTATKGWDAASGFGTPDFAALSKLAMAAVQKEIVV